MLNYLPPTWLLFYMLLLSILLPIRPINFPLPEFQAARKE
jgi:hypothetical protein